ncbi:MAG: hypothetical protein DWQ07_17530 [Chloroflexi bacterium]|nr:MAG: hypothetical protein DWQ07_17530 [Chloroflexota bacterium]
MQNTKLTVRLPKGLLEKAKRYAAEQNTTVTKLIETYLRRIPGESELDNAPIVQRLSGTLSQDLSVEDHKQHLEEKYGQ